MVDVAVTANWLCNYTVPGASVDGPALSSTFLLVPMIIQLMELIVDRSIDFVKASIGQRKDMGDMILLSEAMDLRPSPEPEPIKETKSKEVVVKAAEDEDQMVDYDEDVEDDEGRGSRRRKLVDSTGIDIMDEEDEEYVDPVWAATEAVKAAFRNSRSVYTLYSSNLVQLLINNSPASVKGSAKSLLNYMHRSFFGCERWLSVSLRDSLPPSEGKQVVISASTSIISATFESFPDAIVAWKSYM